jgi:hypothetical protein
MKQGTSELVARRIQELLSPADIAQELDVTTSEAIEQVFIAIGKGHVRESDLFFILATKYSDKIETLDALSKQSPEKWRPLLERLYGDEVSSDKGSGHPQTTPVDIDEIVLYASYRKRQVYMGDMYVYLADLERTLHQRIKCILIEEFGEAETGWWKLGVSAKIRSKCAEARELDGEFVAHAYDYTTLIQLKDIMGDNSDLFSRTLPKSVRGNVRSFLTQMTKLNGIRNQVMHPVREELPTEKDFAFVREMHKNLGPEMWR